MLSEARTSCLRNHHRFTATFFNFELGFFVNGYHGVFANYEQDKSYWQILDGAMKPTPVGMYT